MILDTCLNSISLMEPNEMNIDSSSGRFRYM